MRAVTRMDVQSWIRALVEKGTGASAIKRAYNLTSSIMRAAVDDDVLAVSPCRNIDLPTIAVKPPQWFTLDQAQSILDELPAPWRTMCLLGLYTGLRWGELSGLHCHRIDRRRARLFVVEVNTKSGVKEYPKSSRSRREVPIPAYALEALERHIQGRGRDALVFTTVTKGRAGRRLDDGNWRAADLVAGPRQRLLLRFRRRPAARPALSAALHAAHLCLVAGAERGVPLRGPTPSG